MSILLDANVLIALVMARHVHHDRAEEWLAAQERPFATCPMTEGSLARMLIRNGRSADAAQAILAALAESPRHEFWPDSDSYRQVPMKGVIGHRQVTDAYLAHLARSRGGRLATFDQGLVQLHLDIAELVPVA